MTRPLHPLKALMALVAGGALLVGCSAPGAASAATPATSQSEASADIVRPQRIVAITSETADMALLLAGPQSMAAIAVGSQSPTMGMVPDLARQVETTLPAGVTPDPEQIWSYQPDLVLTTSRHGGEKTANEQLAAAGVPMITFESADFNTPEAYESALRTVGDAVGQPEKAEKYASELHDAIAEIDSQRSDKHPSVLALMARGGNVMAMSSDNMLPGLALRAGASDAAQTAGITATGTIDAELLIRANPDIILLEDFQGSGQAPFAELLANTAVQDVPAIANQNVHLIAMTEASSLAGINLPVGYRKIAELIAQ